MIRQMVCALRVVGQSTRYAATAPASAGGSAATDIKVDKNTLMALRKRTGYR
jgi:hypothetical protein